MTPDLSVSIGPISLGRPTMLASGILPKTSRDIPRIPEASIVGLPSEIGPIETDRSGVT